MFGWSLYMASRYRGQRYNIFFGIRDRPDHFYEIFIRRIFSLSAPVRCRRRRTGRAGRRFRPLRRAAGNNSTSEPPPPTRRRSPDTSAATLRHPTAFRRSRPAAHGRHRFSRRRADVRRSSPRIGTNVERTEDQSVDELENPARHFDSVEQITGIVRQRMP